MIHNTYKAAGYLQKRNVRLCAETTQRLKVPAFKRPLTVWVNLSENLPIGWREKIGV